MKKLAIKFLLILAISGMHSTMLSAEPKKILVVGFGMEKPPYVFEKTDSGLEVEIFREAAREGGYKIKSFFGPMERIKAMLISGELDVITNTNVSESLNFYSSEPFIEYHNYAIALKKKNFKIEKITELRKYSISSFQRARDLLGEDFSNMVKENKNYHEFADQKLRNIQLYKERVDVIIADKRIFGYFNTQLDKSINRNQPITFFNIFKANHYQAAFRSEVEMKKFNEGLKKIKKNGIYSKLEDKYSNYK